MLAAKSLNKINYLAIWIPLFLAAAFMLSGCQSRGSVAPSEPSSTAVTSADLEAASGEKLLEEAPSASPTIELVSGMIVEPAPTPQPIGTVDLYISSVTIPTYPRESYQSEAVDKTFNLAYQQFDYERFRADNPRPIDKDYRTIVVENNYLQLTILPELGGRLWQVLHKASGNRMFYQNDVVKPSPWGPGNQLGWLAVGGLEWNLPVIEHGYDWGTEWGYSPIQHNPEAATVTVFTPWDGRLATASIAISLRAGAASFDIQSTISNLSKTDLALDYWHSAMLAPGSQNMPSEQLHFVLPTNQVIVHSSGDATLPAPQKPLPWPNYNDRDLSTLGTWGEYAGFFEFPTASGPFVGVYDRLHDAGVVRIFPEDVASGSKIFSPGWQTPLPAHNYTDDDSSYVEIHGGLAPSFFEQYRLPAGESVTWHEVWYPVQGIGDMNYANELAAVKIQLSSGILEIAFYPTQAITGNLLLIENGDEIERFAVDASPEQPFQDSSPVSLDNITTLELRFEDNDGRTLLAYHIQ